MRTILALLPLLLLTGPAAGANEDISPEAKKFVDEILESADKHIDDMVELGVLECGPVGLVVNVHNGDMIGLTLRSVIIAARTRLLRARIYQDPPHEVGGIVNVVVLVGKGRSNAFTHRVWFEKQEGNIVTRTRDWSPTGWDHWILGEHGGSATSVINSVERSLDYFIDEFLRVNEWVCL